MCGFKAAWQAFYAEMERLAAQIMAAFAKALDLKNDFFRPYLDTPFFALKALYFPATDDYALQGEP